MTDAVEALGEDVHEEAANELMRVPLARCTAAARAGAGQYGSVIAHPRAPTAGVGEAPRHEIAGGGSKTTVSCSARSKTSIAEALNQTPLDTGPKND
jgi:hypothetical protein